MNLKTRLAVAGTGVALLVPAGTASAQGPYYYPVKVKPSLSLKVKPKRDARKPYKYTATGRLNRKSAAPAACRGKVKVVAKKGSRKVTKRVNVRGNCTYKARFKAKVGKARRGKIKVTARFGGNAVLRAVSAKPKKVAFGRK